MGWLTKLYDATWGRAAKNKKEADAPPLDEEEDDDPDDEDDPDAEEDKGKKSKKKAEDAPPPDDEEDKESDGEDDTDTEKDKGGKGKKKAENPKGSAARDDGGEAGDHPAGSHALFVKLAARFGEDFAARAFRDRLSFTAALDRHDQLTTARVATLEKRLASIGKLGEEDPPVASGAASDKPRQRPSMNEHIDRHAAWLAGGGKPDPAA